MKHLFFVVSVLFFVFSSSAKVVKDTLYTESNDKIIITYEILNSGDNVQLKFESTQPRIIPSDNPKDNLRKACKGDLTRLKVVLFDRVGNFGKIKWKGISPRAFMQPSDISYEPSIDGFYILGESDHLSFIKKVATPVDIIFPIYVAVWEKKQTYNIISSTTKPLKVNVGKVSSKKVRTGIRGTTEEITISSAEELEADNEDITRALSSMQLINQLLETETEFPFSETLKMEIYNLRSLRDRLNDADMIDRINKLLLRCNDKESELKEMQKEASLAAEAKEQAQMAQQKAEEEARQKEAEEKAQQDEEKQQKRTLWMIIGGILLAIVAFVGNAVFKHFRDLRNQKSIMQMQQSIAKQAANEARRRSQEIIRNKAHQVANKGRNKMRESIKEIGKPKKNTKIKSI